MLEEWNKQKQNQRNQLGLSINRTFVDLTNENPDRMEEANIRRAMELSMLDVAIVYHRGGGHHRTATGAPKPHQILGVSETADPAEIKTAYRKLARLHHPDKGGDARRFEEIARAYRSLLSPSSSSSVGSYTAAISNEASTTATWDKELQDHRRLVDDLFQSDGMDLDACVAKQLTALDVLGLTFRDVGTTNRNERNEIITNSCFYLSLATSYLLGIGALSYSSGDTTNETNQVEDELLIGDTALHLKRTIEAAVVTAHPEWAVQGKVGEEVQAFSDFLVYTLDSQTLLSEWAVVVFDSTSGFCDVYKGRNYDRQRSSSAQQSRNNTITLRYEPGHYQPLIPSSSSSSSYANRPALNDVVSALDSTGVFYVVTDGNS